MRAAIADRALERVLEQLELLDTTDELRTRPELAAGAVESGDEAPRAERLDPLELEGLPRPRPRGFPQRGGGRRADEDLPRPRDLLEARGEVDGLAGRERRFGASTTSSPASIPTACSPSSTTESRIASGRRMARSASSSCAWGTPNAARTASPANFSTSPPCCATQLETVSKNSFTRRRTTSGSVPATRLVESTRSTNSTVASFRSILQL